MKIIMYGAEICPDCVDAKEKLKANTDIEFDYRDITKSTKTLKEFLSYRDHDEVFTTIIEVGKIGIPFFILENGSKTFEVQDILKEEKSEQVGNFCSIDGKGC